MEYFSVKKAFFQEILVVSKVEERFKKTQPAVLCFYSLFFVLIGFLSAAVSEVVVAGAPSKTGVPSLATMMVSSLYGELMLMKQAPLSDLLLYAHPIKATSPVLANRKPLYAEFYSRDDNRGALKELSQYFYREKEHLKSRITVGQAIDHLVERSQKGYAKARSLLVSLGVPASLYEQSEGYEKSESKSSGYGVTSSIPLLGFVHQYFASKSEREAIEKLHRSTSKTENLAHLNTQTVVSSGPVLSSDEILQDRRDRQKIKVMRTEKDRLSLGAKVFLGFTAVGLGARAFALPTPAAHIQMSPVTHTTDNNLEGSVTVSGCPSGDCPGVLSFSQGTAHSHFEMPLCQIDIQQCNEPVCTVSSPTPHCNLEATKTAHPNGDVEIQYTVKPGLAEPFKMSYTSGGQHKSVNYAEAAETLLTGAPTEQSNPTVRTNTVLEHKAQGNGSVGTADKPLDREKRAEITCYSMDFDYRRNYYIGNYGQKYTHQGTIGQGAGAYEFSTRPVRVCATCGECDPLVQVWRDPNQFTSGAGAHNEIYRENSPDSVMCTGGFIGKRIPEDLPGAWQYDGGRPRDDSNETFESVHLCAPPPEDAFNCMNSTKFGVVARHGPFDVSNLPLGSVNRAMTAAEGTDPLMIRVQQGLINKYVRFSQARSYLLATYPEKKCHGENSGEINLEFLQSWDVENSLFSDQGNDQANCESGKTFRASVNTPANPLDISDIPAGELRTALTGDANALVTDGTRYVRWGDFINVLESTYTNATCKNFGPPNGKINAEFLLQEDFKTALDTASAMFPGLNCSAANSFNVADNPQQAFNIQDIPLGNMNQALSSASDDTLITDGSGRYINWGALKGQVKISNPQAVCLGEKTGEPNGEFLPAGSLQTAFDVAHESQPARQFCQKSVMPEKQGTVSTMDEVLDAFESGAPVQLDLSSLVFNGTHYASMGTLVNEFPDTLEFYHQHGCLANNSIFRQIDKATFEETFAAANLGNLSIAPNDCSALVISVNKTSQPLEVQNVTALFEDMAADYSDVGLHFQDDQMITRNGTDYAWGGLSLFLSRDKLCEEARADNGDLITAFKDVTEETLDTAIEKYDEYQEALLANSTTEPTITASATASPIAQEQKIAQGAIAGGILGGVAGAGGAAYSAFSIIDGVHSVWKHKKPNIFNYPARVLKQLFRLVQFRCSNNNSAKLVTHPGWKLREAAYVRRALGHKKYNVESSEKKSSKKKRGRNIQDLWETAYEASSTGQNVALEMTSMEPPRPPSVGSVTQPAKPDAKADETYMGAAFRYAADWVPSLPFWNKD